MKQTACALLAAFFLFLTACAAPAPPPSQSPPPESTPPQTEPAPKQVPNYYVEDLDDDIEDQSAVDALYWYLYGNLAPKDYTRIVLYKGLVSLDAMEKAPIDALLQDYDGPWAPIYFSQASFSRVDLMQAEAAIKTFFQEHPGSQLKRLNVFENGTMVYVEVVEITDELIAFVESYPIQGIFEISKFVPEEDFNPD